MPKIWTCDELLKTEFPEPDWVVPGIVPDGLTVLAGGSKMGKSWMALHIALAASLGTVAFGKVRVPRRKVLYLALEDTPRRIKNRINKLEGLPSDNLLVATEWGRGETGIEMLKATIQETPDIGLIIIDTLGKFFPAGADGNHYHDVTDILSPIKKFADDLCIPIIAIHHGRKNGGEDFVNNLIGSHAFAAVTDTILSLHRGRGQSNGILNITGRDVEEQELGMRFDKDVGAWTIIGNADEVAVTPERQAIIEVLRERPSAKTGDIAAKLGKSHQAVSNLLKKMKNEGQVSSTAYGLWSAAGVSGVSDITGVSDVSGVSDQEPSYTTYTTYTDVSGCKSNGTSRGPFPQATFPFGTVVLDGPP